ncbi:MAG: DTW domain-containing protein [Myxococcales bacterium]|nr:DTW domain-containing protein [Myxococcales bacterium]
MTGAIRSRRLERCAGCGLDVTLCICRELPRLRTRTRVLVLMHKTEALRTSNTGRLALKMLDSASVVVRGARGEPMPAPPPGSRRVVLYPGPESRELSALDANGDEPLTLVVPDGSWSQARRMLRREAWAIGAEVVRLPPHAASRYNLRRQVRPQAVCTLEAIACALGLLEGPELRAALEAALETFLVRARHMRRSGGAFSPVFAANRSESP